MDKRHTQINASIIPEEPDTNEIDQQICHSWDYQVMPRSWSHEPLEKNDQHVNRNCTAKMHKVISH